MKFGFEQIRDFTRLIRELSVGLGKLNFSQNFESFEVDVLLTANSTTRIRNELSFIPSRRIIVRQDAEAVISDSSTTWTANYVYLQNHHAANNVTVKVIFMR